MNQKKIELHDVTLCIVDSVTPQLSLRAIRKSQENCNFNRSVLFTDAKVDTDNHCELVSINKINSINDYSYFLLKELNSYIKTKFVLIIQWDGYVIDANSWKCDFMTYDYIGAKWDWHHDGGNVGNGGFSLRSKKLLDITSSDYFEFIPNVPEDVQISRINKNFLMNQQSIKFAPVAIADQFSYERSLPQSSTFGFHGLFNMWRHNNDDEMIEVIESLSPNSIKSREFVELMIEYYRQRKFNILKTMYAKTQLVQTKLELKNKIHNLTADEDFSILLSNLCEQVSCE